MPAPARTPRDRWISAGLEALADSGPDGVRIEALAAKLGVTKGGFYGYFPNRAALLTEMLDEWERRTTRDVLAQVERDGGDAAEKMRKAGLLTFSDEILPIELAVRSWARHDTGVATRLKRVDNARIGYLRTLFGTYVDDPDEIEARSTLAFTLAIGHHFMAADHEARTEHDALSLAAEFVLRPLARQRSTAGSRGTIDGISRDAF